ncbi:MAG: NAD(P)-dependent oxidoreductase [Oligoflexia bacterium]|nr:NAD(P)-dependent oxidoreductase [Oligoflexia bacterium]
MKILLTGSTGFVGSHLSELLVSAGHELYSLARNPKKFEEFQVAGKLVKGSLPPSGDLAWLDELPDDLDAVIHTAGVVHSFNEFDFINVNTLATKNLVEKLKDKYQNLNFVLVSSLAGAGPSSKEKINTEEHLPKPASEYGKSKLKAEEILNELAPQTWKTSIVRPPMVIGPRDPAVLDIFKMVQSRVVLYAGLDSKEKLYSFVCVFDLIEVIKRAVESEKEMRGEVFYASHPETITMDQLINKIKKAMNKSTMNLIVPFFVVKGLAHTLDKVRKVVPIQFRLTPDKLNELEPDCWTCSGQKSIESLGMNYQWDIDKTIQATLEDYTTRRWL